MTLIAIHNRTMIADSLYFCGGLRFPSPNPKILRTPAGSLFGCGGTNRHTRLLREWAAAGMDFANQPKLIPETDDNEGNNGKWLWLRPDGRAFYGHHDMQYSEISSPDYCGVEVAGNLWLGQVWAGIDGITAMHNVIKHCIYVGGHVDVLTLDEHPAPYPLEYLEHPLTGKATPR